MGQRKQLALQTTPTLPGVDQAQACALGARALRAQLRDLAFDANRFERQAATDPIARASFIRYHQLRAAALLLEARNVELRAAQRAATIAHPQEAFGSGKRTLKAKPT